MRSHPLPKGDQRVTLTVSSTRLIKCQNVSQSRTRTPEPRWRWPHADEEWISQRLGKRRVEDIWPRRLERATPPWSTVGAAPAHTATCRRRRGHCGGPGSVQGKMSRQGCLKPVCVAIGLYDVQPGGNMHGRDIMHPLRVLLCLCVCTWTPQSIFRTFIRKPSPVPTRFSASPAT